MTIFTGLKNQTMGAIVKFMIDMEVARQEAMKGGSL